MLEGHALNERVELSCAALLSQINQGLAYVNIRIHESILMLSFANKRFVISDLGRDRETPTLNIVGAFRFAEYEASA